MPAYLPERNCSSLHERADVDNDINNDYLTARGDLTQESSVGGINIYGPHVSLRLSHYCKRNNCYQDSDPIFLHQGTTCVNTLSANSNVDKIYHIAHLTSLPNHPHSC